MAQQTAVEWFIYKLNGCDSESNDFIFNGVITSELIEEIKQMEKEQIIKAYVEGVNLVPCDLNSTDELDAEKYYNETFGNN